MASGHVNRAKRPVSYTHLDVYKRQVLAQGLGDEDRQAPRDEKGDRGAGTSIGRDPAPHMG